VIVGVLAGESKTNFPFCKRADIFPALPSSGALMKSSAASIQAVLSAMALCFEVGSYWREAMT
jgi:hypothetical protein